MSAFPARPTAIVLLLAALALSGVLAGEHSHDPLAGAAPHAELPTFSGGHAQPDRTSHVESATSLERSVCVGCLLRQRQRSAVWIDPAAERLEPGRLAEAPAPVDQPAVGARRLPATRAPPAA